MSEVTFDSPAHAIGQLHEALYDAKTDHIQLADGYLNQILDDLNAYKDDLRDNGYKAEAIAVLAIIAGISYPIEQLRTYFKESRCGDINKSINKKAACSHFEMIQNILVELNMVSVSD